MEIIIKCSDDVRGGTNIYGEPIKELVRCKECKHREEYPCKVYHDDDWFCANGERKGE